MLTFHSRWALAGALLLPMAVMAAGSVPLAVAPVTVKMDTATEYGAVEVSNRGDSPTGVEIEILRVRWVDGQEEYEPTSDFVVSPAAFRIAAGKSRMVRFRYAAARQATEGFYRLFIRQLPENRPDNQISMVFNIGVPVFIAPSAARPELAVAVRSGAGEVSELHNTGNVTLKVLQLEGENCPEGVHKLVARIFPAQKLPLEAGVSRCATGAQTDRGLIAFTPLTPAAKP